MAANALRCLEGRDVVAAALGAAPTAPDEMTGSMAVLAVPASVRPEDGGTLPVSAAGSPDDDVTLPDDPLNGALFEEDAIEVPVGPWPQTRGRGGGRAPMRLLRISAQAYNSADDYERLAAALRRRMAAP